VWSPKAAEFAFLPKKAAPTITAPAFFLEPNRERIDIICN